MRARAAPRRRPDRNTERGTGRKTVMVDQGTEQPKALESSQLKKALFFVMRRVHLWESSEFSAPSGFHFQHFSSEHVWENNSAATKPAAGFD